MNKLWIRLSIGFSLMVLSAVFVVALAGIVVGWLERGGRDRNVDNRPPRETAALANSLADHYRTAGTWGDIEPLLLKAQSRALPGQRPERIPVYFLADANQQILYHIEPELVGQPVEQKRYTQLIPIRVDNQTVGYLGSISVQFLNDDNAPPDFFTQLLIRTLLTAAAIAGGGGIIFGIVMSRTLTAPLDELALAARDIGARQWNRRVDEKGADEIIDVARAFNEMAADLEQGETLRRNLLADVAHELRTPLTVLQGNLRAILDKVYPMNEEEMGRLYEHTRFLSRLVNDLHELAQAEAHQLPLDLQPTNLNPLARTACDNFVLAAIEKEVSVHTTLADDLPPVNIDPARINQVLQNLLANALRHTPTGGRVTVSTRSTENGVQLAVADTGEGIAPDYLPHVFDRFYRADPARSRDKGGAGLGLAIVRAIVEAHAGHVTAESGGIPGQGTTFTITLPIAQKTAQNQ